MFDGFTSFTNANPWLNFIFLLLAIGSIVVTIITYLRSKKDKIPVYITKSFSLFHPATQKVPGLDIEFSGKKLEALTLTQIAFWNKGLEPIRRADIAPADRLRVEIPKNSILVGAYADFISNDSNAFKISQEEHTVFIEFDFVEHLEGIRFNVYHTGSEDSEIKIKGSVIGAQKISSGYVGENYISEKYISPIVRRLPQPESTFWRLITSPLYMVVLTPLLMPLGVLLMPMDLIYRLMYSPPTVFNLLDEKEAKGVALNP